jgi:hypothetical protein
MRFPYGKSLNKNCVQPGLKEMAGEAPNQTILLLIKRSGRFTDRASIPPPSLNPLPLHNQLI